jgi:FtsH-binding integral membrane protein
MNSTSQTTILNQSFGWMFIGLIVTGLSSYFVAASPALTSAISNNNVVFFGLLIAELVMVAVLSSKIRSMTFVESVVSFLVYAFLNGLTLSSVFIVYTGQSIVTIFFVTALMFGVMALYGYTTGRDLTSLGGLALAALVGIIIASLVNFFVKSDAFSYVLSVITVLVFIGLTAYDTQKIKQMETFSDNHNLGILGALTLYLDFLNIFLNLLRLFGRAKEQ